jgi:hypothetical protein
MLARKLLFILLNRNITRKFQYSGFPELSPLVLRFHIREYCEAY